MSNLVNKAYSVVRKTLEQYNFLSLQKSIISITCLVDMMDSWMYKNTNCIPVFLFFFYLKVSKICRVSELIVYNIFWGQKLLKLKVNGAC